MTRKRSGLSKLPDDKTHQMTFTKRKNNLMKKAMELSVLCECDIALIIFSSSGRLYQYSSTDMKAMLERHSRACLEPHEQMGNDELFKQLYQSKGDDDLAELDDNGRAPKRQRDFDRAGLPPLPPPLSLKRAPLTDDGRAGTSGDQQHIKPAGFLDKSNYPVSPKSEKAYEEITAEFDRLFEKVSQTQGSGPSTGMPPPGRTTPPPGWPGEGGSALPGPSTSAAQPSSGGKRFKPLSIVVPENLSREIPPPNAAAAAAASAAAAAQASAAGASRGDGAAGDAAGGAQGADGGAGGAGRPAGSSGPAAEGQQPAAGSSGQAGQQQSRQGEHGAASSSHSEGGCGGLGQSLLALPSPGMGMFGPLSMGLFSARGSGNVLDGLPTPDSSYQLGTVGDAFDWPSPSPRSNIAGGFASDDGGDVMSGDGLMVTGKGLKTMSGTAAATAIGHTNGHSLLGANDIATGDPRTRGAAATASGPASSSGTAGAAPAPDSSGAGGGTIEQPAGGGSDASGAAAGVAVATGAEAVGGASEDTKAGGTPGEPPPKE